MLPEDEEVLKELFLNYSPQLIMKRLSVLALEAASDCSDNGLKDRAKELVQFSIAMEDLTSGRPFLL